MRHPPRSFLHVTARAEHARRHSGGSHDPASGSNAPPQGGRAVADQRGLGFQASVSNLNAQLASGSWRLAADGFRRRCVTSDGWSGLVLTDASADSGTPGSGTPAA